MTCRLLQYRLRPPAAAAHCTFGGLVPQTKIQCCRAEKFQLLMFTCASSMELRSPENRRTPVCTSYGRGKERGRWPPANGSRVIWPRYFIRVQLWHCSLSEGTEVHIRDTARIVEVTDFYNTLCFKISRLDTRMFWIPVPRSSSTCHH
jgi:hypothetical protein